MDARAIAAYHAELARQRWKGTTRKERVQAMRDVALKGWASGKRPRAKGKP